MTWCPLHFTNGKIHSADIAKRLKECLICKQMLLSIIPSSYAFGSSPTGLGTRDYDGEALLSVIGFQLTLKTLIASKVSASKWNHFSKAC